MIYSRPSADEPLDQADLIDACPLVYVSSFRVETAATEVDIVSRRIVVLTQTCDLAHEKTTMANVAEVFEAQYLVDRQILKAADVKGSLRAGRVWGLYFLPACSELSLNEMIVDFRGLHTVPFKLLAELCRAGKRVARVQTPYREHLAKHFADTFSRIGLPQPYETL